MPRRKQYKTLVPENPFQLHSDILKYLNQYASASNERLIMIALVRSLESMPKSSMDAEIIALIQLLAERVQQESDLLKGETDGTETSI
jgi:hypothetical protein